jgi:8-oxo-dGTP diphosphatase
MAERVRVDPSTYRSWEDGQHRPRPSNIRALCSVLGVREDELGFGVEPAEQIPSGVLRIAIAVVVNGPDVLLVHTRDESGARLWQFPAGMIKPETTPVLVAVRETFKETGIHCAVRRHLGSRIHPITGVFCDYFLCEYLTGTVENRDVSENIAVAWVERSRVTGFIPVDHLFPPVLAALEANEE